MMGWTRRQASPRLFSPPKEGKLSPRPSRRPEATSVTCSYSMRASPLRTLNCACQVTVTQPHHSIFISFRRKLENNGRKTFNPLERVCQPSARFQLPPPLPLTLLRSSYVFLPHTWALVVLEYVRESCIVDVTCRAVLERVLRSPYCQVIIYCSNIPLQQGLRQSGELAQSGCDPPP